MKDLFLTLEDGKVFRGKSLSQCKTTTGFLSFYTGAFGYEEVITNPANTGKIILFTFPIIGAYGINLRDNQSDSVCIAGAICKDYSKIHSNFRAKKSVCEYMDEFGKVLGDSFDTRAIMVHLREAGEQLAVISDKELSKEEASKIFMDFKIDYKPINTYTEPKKTEIKAKIIDLGANKTFYNFLFEAGIKISDDENYNTVIISNTNPMSVEDEKIINMVSKVIIGKVVVGIGDGAAIAAKARGFCIKKLLAGHHGNNLPVKPQNSNKNLITTQNHDFIVCEQENINITYRNLHDNSEEGFISHDMMTLGFSFRPDTELFCNTIKEMEAKNHA